MIATNKLIKKWKELYVYDRSHTGNLDKNLHPIISKEFNFEKYFSIFTKMYVWAL